MALDSGFVGLRLKPARGAVRAWQVVDAHRPACLVLRVVDGGRGVHLSAARGIAARRRIDERYPADKKAAILQALIADYDSACASHLVPVCKDVDQPRAMYEEMSSSPPGVEAFVDSPCMPEGVLPGIASSSGPAWEMLPLRVDQRASSAYSDVTPS